MATQVSEAQVHFVLGEACTEQGTDTALVIEHPLAVKYLVAKRYIVLTRREGRYHATDAGHMLLAQLDFAVGVPQ